MNMSEIGLILRSHLERYPRMQPQDCIKLLYQSEFGCEHFVIDESSARKRLEYEYASVAHDPEHIMVERIGNGWTRVHLEPLEARGITIEMLLHAFVRSSRICSGLYIASDRDTALDSALDTVSGQKAVSDSKQDKNKFNVVYQFEEKLKLIGPLCEEGITCFSHVQLDKFLKRYRCMGYPPIHHSEAFTAEYHPAYRVIWEGFLGGLGL